MNLPEAIATLIKFNKWRRGAEMPMPSPKEIGEAIEIAIHLMKGMK